MADKFKEITAAYEVLSDLISVKIMMLVEVVLVVDFLMQALVLATSWMRFLVVDSNEAQGHEQGQDKMR